MKFLLNRFSSLHISNNNNTTTTTTRTGNNNGRRKITSNKKTYDLPVHRIPKHERENHISFSSSPTTTSTSTSRNQISITFSEPQTQTNMIAAVHHPQFTPTTTSSHLYSKQDIPISVDMTRNDNFLINNKQLQQQLPGLTPTWNDDGERLVASILLFIYSMSSNSNNNNNNGTVSSPWTTTTTTPAVDSYYHQQNPNQVQGSYPISSTLYAEALNTAFTGKTIPSIPLSLYIRRIIIRLNAWNEEKNKSFTFESPGVISVVGGLVLLQRLHLRAGLALTPITTHRALLACVVVAHKFIEDECAPNHYLAMMGGVDLSRINEMEAIVCKALDHSITITDDVLNLKKQLIAL
jgi:hypothetical protein